MRVRDHQAREKIACRFHSRTQQRGWLTDKYGVTWQIVPTILGELLQGKDAAKSARAMKAMMQMIKLDIAALRKAYHEN